MNRFSTVLRASLLAPALLAGLQSLQAESASEIEVLRDQIRQLDQKLRVLERKEEIRNEETAAKAKSQVAVTAGAGGFGLSSADKSFDLKFKLLAQVDARFFIGDESPGNSGFLLRRIRPSLQGTVGGIFDFAVVPEYAGGNSTTSSTSLVDAWISTKLSPAFVLKAGKFTSPVGLEPGSNRHFIESPFVNTLLPNRDIGVELSGADSSGLLSYRLGVFNGARNNTTSFASDAEDAKTLAGRLTVLPFKSGGGALAKLALGVGFSVGSEEGSLQGIVTNAQQSLLNFGTLTADGSHRRLSPSLSLYSGAFSAVAEYAWEEQDYRRGTAAFFEGNNSAWRATLGIVLTGEESTDRGVTPRASFNPAAGTWGAWELVTRASAVTLDEALFTASLGGLSASSNAREALAYGIGLNWYLNRSVRAQLNFEHTAFEGGGAGALKHDENALFSRLQLSF